MIKYILAAIFMGAVVGYANNNYGFAVYNYLVSNYLFNFALLLLLFVMGFVFGADREAFAKIRKGGLKILVVPVAVALGSLLGGFVGGFVLGMGLVECVAVAGGFGWYTLAGPLVGQLFGPVFGALAFVSNFFRELFTIVAVPLLVKLDKLAPVATGGATSMDTTLPVITRYAGNDILIIAFSSGFVLSAAAPFVISGVAALQMS